ncbi:Aste57867_21843 [Aphanomyces stellatus]|uniref:Aste57867_21843 protein n=1 Tax=Aphanomyces stellatus TaxID=120398 RepID=A0A485LIK7_9STRA|nr:hypothetical protein As57867_021774 [Aphanomyces stellatus]VFT98512.1 Aste57867_21843 [Aphanomyces stellatus]
MAAAAATNFGFDGLPAKEFILINDVVEASGTYFIHHFTSMFVKADQRVCLIGLGNSLEHYRSVGRKLGVNVQNAQNSRMWLHIDGLSSPYDWCDGNGAPESNAFQASSSEDDLRILVCRVRDFVTQSDRPCVVVVDDITALSIDYGVSHTLNFLRFCRRLVFKTNSTLLVLNHADAEQDGAFFTPALVDMATFVYTVRGLDSGYCKDVHGSVTMGRRMFGIEAIPKETTVQYKLVENGIRIIHSGVDP